jgi:poly-beta-1,6-N-acetyl-D-glucosamine synthase
MTIVLYILLGALALYGIILLWLAIGFVRTKTTFHEENETCIPVTIIICARNEEKKIGKCLKTIVQQDYDLSKIQIIVVNDASSDSTVLQAQAALKESGLNYRIISNAEQKGKKQSITYAMQFAQHNLIITRDADTFTTSYSWLKIISDHYSEHESDMIIGPLAIANNAGMLWALQAIENNTLSVLNCGSSFYKRPFLCNGANLIFTKSIFEKTEGYSRHLHIKSGDDVLFLEEIKKVKGSNISYLKSPEAIVYTYPCFSFGSLLSQKIRWASKFKVNKNPINFSLAGLTFLVNAAWLLCLFYGFLVPQNGGLSLNFVLLKLLIDFLLLFLASHFLKNKALVFYALPVGCIYPIYAVVVASASLFLKPKWK